MSDQQFTRPEAAHPQFVRPLDAVALKWRNLAERRRTHFIDLYLSGRWKHYYTEEQFLTRFHETVRNVNRWAEISPKPSDASLQAS